jgi:urease accessory protein
VRIAWHLGNRHLPTQLLPGDNANSPGGFLRIRHDHVIAEMVEGLGGACQPVLAPFDPEGGAYEGGGGHHHDHAHAHG